MNATRIVLAKKTKEDIWLTMAMANWIDFTSQDVGLTYFKDSPCSEDDITGCTTLHHTHYQRLMMACNTDHQMELTTDTHPDTTHCVHSTEAATGACTTTRWST